MTCDASVLVLFRASRPAHVARLVVAVIVHAFQREVRAWSRSHISEEVLETDLPTPADCNPPAAVVAVTAMVRVMATLLHSLPDLIHCPIRVTFSAFSLLDSLTPEASTTSRVSSFHAISGAGKGIAAIAFEFPNMMAVGRSFPGRFDRHKASKSLTGDVNYFHE